MVRSFLVPTAFAALFGATAVGPAQADVQDKYPSRPVKIIVSLPAGSSADIRTRIIAEQLTKMWGQQVVVENRPGGGGLIAVHALLSAAADGHTLLVATGSTFTILPAQKENLPINVNRDLIPIGLVANEPMLIAASPKLGVNTLADLIALAKREPHKIVIGTTAAGTLQHLAGRLLVERSHAPMTVLPFTTGGGNEAIRNIMGGRVHVVVDARPSLKGTLDAGDLKALAIMSSERQLFLPDLPTAAETIPGLTAVGFLPLVAPKGTPAPIVQRLAEDLRRALETVRTRLEHVGTPMPLIFSTELVRFIESEQRLWWPIVKESGPK
jgi:tripartite-type tricarboxylate transporter receptor subunit TctC